MKKLWFVLILLTVWQPGSSQIFKFRGVNSYNTDRMAILSASPTVLFDTPNGTQYAAGIKLQVFLTERISIDADLVFSRDYVHLSPALIGVPLALIVLGNNDENMTFTEFLACVAVLALSLEHVSYHIPVFNNFDVSPYVGLLRYKIAYEFGNYSATDYITEQFSFAAGFQLNKYIGRFVFSPYAEYCIGYKDHKSGYNIGAYLGIYF